MLVNSNFIITFLVIKFRHGPYNESKYTGVSFQYGPCVINRFVLLELLKLFTFVS